jgi:hypothetical protein
MRSYGRNAVRETYLVFDVRQQFLGVLETPLAHVERI